MIMEAAAADTPAAQVTCLFDRYHGELYGYLARVVSDRQTAEDLVQETFLRAYRARAQLTGIENPRAWLYRIATNLALNAIHRRKRFAWLPWNAANAESGPSDLGDQVSTSSAVEKALARLSPEYRIPLLLSSHFGFSIRELAEAMGISEGAVKVRLSRAREMFRQAYKREEEA